MDDYRKKSEAQKVLILSGGTDEVESALNAVLEYFSPIVWNVSTVKDEVILTVVLLNNSYMRRAQLAVPVVGPGGRIQ